MQRTTITLCVLLLLVVGLAAASRAPAAHSHYHNIKANLLAKDGQEADAAAADAAASVGDRLLRTFFVFSKQPLTLQEARKDGWYNVTSTCNPAYGWPVALTEEGATQTSPTWLFYTQAGELAGFGLRVWAQVSRELVDAGLFLPVSDGESYDIYILTRDPSLMCSGAKDPSSAVVGDRLNINGRFPIPLTMPLAQSSGWVMGNCIPQMGIHHAFDLAAPYKQTWNASTLVPVMPMYDAKTQHINAILFNVWNLQWVEPLGMYEGPFTNGLFCKNWCAESGCGWEGVSVWTTLHFHFVDPETISCEGAPCKLFG